MRVLSRHEFEFEKNNPAGPYGHAGLFIRRYFFPRLVAVQRRTCSTEMYGIGRLEMAKGPGTEELVVFAAVTRNLICLGEVVGNESLQRTSLQVISPVDLADAHSPPRQIFLARIGVPVVTPSIRNLFDPVLSDIASNQNVRFAVRRIEDKQVQMQTSRSFAFFQFPDSSMNAFKQRMRVFVDLPK